MPTPKSILEAESLLPKLDPAFERGVAIVSPQSSYVTPAFLRLVDRFTPKQGCIACTMSVMDILARPSRRYETIPGRHFAMYLSGYASSCFDTTLAAAVHEASHFLVDRHPSRDEPDERKATRDWWGTWEEPADGGHNRDWHDALVHLWYRAADCGGEIPFSTFGLEDYGFGRNDLAAVLPEVERRRHEPIEQILRSRSRTNSTRAAIKNTKSKNRRKRFPKPAIVAGQFVTLHADGSIVRPAGLDGTPARRFANTTDFYAAVFGDEWEENRQSQRAQRHQMAMAGTPMD